MPKISVLFTTNKLNKNHFQYLEDVIIGMNSFLSFNDEFNFICRNTLDYINHFIDTTLISLNNQTFKDFELIISHRYPEDILESVKKYNFPIKVVKEKHSIWHDLGNYNTVANNKNNAIIHSNGELLFHIDDFTIFNENTLQEAWDMYQDGKYITSKTYRCIEYNSDKYKETKTYNKGPMKIVHEGDGWYGEEKPLTLSPNTHQEIPMSMFWTCGATVSRDEILEINGYDEVWDGSLCGIDMDAGNRLSTISKFKRVASDNYIYEINDFAKKTMIRDDVMFREICKQSLPNIRYTRANSWKPSKTQSNKYKYWHEKNLGLLDENWDKFYNVPYNNLKELYEQKNMEDVIYFNY